MHGHQISGEQKWTNLTNTELNWKHIWNNTFYTYCYRIENNTH